MWYLSGMDDAGEAECPGPHRQCQACGGQTIEFRETLYVPRAGRPMGLAAPHACWHCRGSGHVCEAERRCSPPRD
ncbi:hypothetical protein DEH69_24505 [Streptomyces sp. PT12]|nr:hypothetical protein DEH69_24505 [Streptomyces sp. PT12]